jgi:putative membrane protein
MWPYWEYNYNFGPFGFLIWILIWILILGIIFRVLRLLLGGRPSRRYWISSHRALEILKERYARGEIGQAEFEEKKADLLR